MGTTTRATPVMILRVSGLEEELNIGQVGGGVDVRRQQVGEQPCHPGCHDKEDGQA